MLDRSHGLAVFALIFLNFVMADQSLAGLRILAFRKAAEILRTDGAGQAKLGSKLAMPLTFNLTALFPIILFGRGELFSVVCLRLVGTQRFRDGQHNPRLSPDVYRRRAIARHAGV